MEEPIGQIIDHIRGVGSQDVSQATVPQEIDVSTGYSFLHPNINSLHRTLNHGQLSLLSRCSWARIDPKFNDTNVTSCVITLVINIL